MANGLNYSSGNTLTTTTNGVKRGIVDADGNYGFGTLAPLNLVDISGSTSTPLRVRGLASSTEGNVMVMDANGVVSYRDDVLVGGSISDNEITLTDSDGTTATLTVQAVTAVTYNDAWDIALDGTGTIGSTPVALPFITGGTYSSGTITLGINGDSNESDITISGIDGDDTFVTGATFSNGTATLTRNDDETVQITGIWTNIPNDALENDSVIIGNTEVELGGTVTTFAGLTSVTSSAFVGPLTGNVTGNVVGDVTGDVSGNAGTATILETGRNFSISGDLTAAAVSFNGSGNVVLNASIDAGVVGTTELADLSVTTGKIAAGAVTNAKLANSLISFSGDSGTPFDVSLGDGVELSSSDSSVTISANAGVIDFSVEDSTDTFVTGGTFSSGTITFTNNDDNTFDVEDIWTNIPTSALVDPGFILGTTTIELGDNVNTVEGLSSVTSIDFIGDLTGNADTADSAFEADTWSTARTLSLGNDLSGSVSIDGSQNVTLNASIVAGSVDTFELADGGVTNDKLAGSIANAKLSNSSITVSDGVNDSPIALGGTLTFDGGTGLDASEDAGTVTFSIDSSVVTLSGSQTLTNKVINGSQLVDGSVSNAKLDNSAITLQGDSGVNQTISLGDTMRFSGGTGLDFEGVTNDEMHVVIDSSLVQFKSEKGQNNGYASLDGSGKVPASQLPASVFNYKGAWNADTNTPTLANGTGNSGDVYRVTVAGTSLGEDWTVGDLALYDGSVWQRVDGDDAVESVNGQQGVVVLDTDDIDEGSTNLYDKVVSLSSGTGISATGTYPNFTITNSDLGSSQNIFKTISVPTGTDPVADTNNDTLSFISSDSSVSISGSSGSDTIDITVGSSVNTNIYNSNGTLSANRTVTQSGNSLAFTGGDFTVDGTTLSVDESASAVGIGVAVADASAVLEVASTSKGFLFPRMSETQRGGINSPATGLMVYQTDGDEGVYIYKSFGWVQVI